MRIDRGSLFDVEKDDIQSILFLAMTVAAKKLAEQALALSVDERQDLICLIRDSISREGVSQEDWDKAWKDELNARIEEMESGEDPGVPLDVIWEDLRKLAEKR